MSRRKAKSSARDKIHNDSNAILGWTTQHHLVGNTLQRSFLCPTGNSYESKESTLTAVAFQSEDTALRRPALWRSLVQGENHQDPAHAFDCVAGDWQGSKGDPVQPVPSEEALAAVRERYQSIVYEAVVNDWLPNLIMTAAVEECQAHYLKQAVMERATSGDMESSSRGRNNSIHASPARYYQQNPNTYLVSPTTGTGAGKVDDQAYVMPVQFTPSQLVHRIKQGCNMVFAEYERLYSSADNGMDNALQRRASSRIARTAVAEEPMDPTLYWKVLPGGRVATLLKERLMDAEEAKGSDGEGSVADDKDTVMKIEVDAKPSAKPITVESSGEAAVNPYCDAKVAKDNEMGPPAQVKVMVSKVPSDTESAAAAPIDTASTQAVKASPAHVELVISQVPSDTESATAAAIDTASTRAVAVVKSTTSEHKEAVNGTAVERPKPSSSTSPSEKLESADSDPNAPIPLVSKVPSETESAAAVPVEAASTQVVAPVGSIASEQELSDNKKPDTEAKSSTSPSAEIESSKSPSKGSEQIKPAIDAQSEQDGVLGDSNGASLSKSIASPVSKKVAPQEALAEAESNGAARPVTIGLSNGEIQTSESPVASAPMDVDDEENVEEDVKAEQDEEYAPQPEEADADEDASGEYVAENPAVLAVESPKSRRRRKSKLNDRKKRSRRKTEDLDVVDTVEDEPVPMDVQVEMPIEEDEEDIDVVNGQNPFLDATPQAIIEWCGRKTAKLLTTADLQQSFPALLHIPVVPNKSKKKKKPAATHDPSLQAGGQLNELLNETDRMIWEKTLSETSVLEGDSARLVLQLINDIDPSEIHNWDTASFGRSNFTVRILNDGAKKELSRQAQEEVAMAEHSFRAQRTWENWRYKGIQNGFTIWPDWFKAVEAWITENNHGPELAPNHLTKDLAEPKAESEADLAIAQAIADQESATATGGRRKTRRAIDGGGVFYGNQATMTQKQLMDTILRLTSQKSYHSSMGLITAVPDESSDPMRRIRSALGKLIWKRRQLMQFAVDSQWTDAKISERLLKQPLIQFATPMNDTGDTSIQKDETKSSRLVMLIDYLKSLHFTELQLRRLVVKHLSEIPIHVIATAADERTGSNEAMDEGDFEDPSQIEWLTSGHELLGQEIFRPLSTDDVICSWYRIEDYTPGIESVVDETDPVPTEKPNIGSAKESQAVRRRMRFRAAASRVREETDRRAESSLILTEAQAIAGLKAAEMERGSGSTAVAPNPFAGSKGSKVTLLPPEESRNPPINGTVVGYDSEVTDNEAVRHRILLLADGSAANEEAFWVTMVADSSGVTQCTLPDRSVVYTLQQFDYHTDSPAFQQCRAIVVYLRRHPKASAFLEPVDPVSLNIPDYFQVVKNPMDISTLSEKLERGEYSSIGANETSGHNPISRMLNGPFRRDLELIFDNAMIFNPPNDWIHIAASTVKKAAVKKIEQASSLADESFEGGSKKKSVYVDYDSDVDMYKYESDHDDEYDGERRGRKRKKQSSKIPRKEDPSSRTIERPLRLQKFLSTTMGLRGPFANLQCQSDASMFSLPPDWKCRRRGAACVERLESNSDDQGETGLNDLVSMYRDLEQTEVSARRSTRSIITETATTEKKDSAQTEDLEYYTEKLDIGSNLPGNRTEVELVCEKLHEELFAKMYYDNLQSVVLDEDDSGLFADSSFPPYLGRVVPSGGQDTTWEIREAYSVTALRWVLRGLLQSGHLSEVEPVDSTDSGVIVPNNVYYIDESQTPFQVVDVRQLTRRKRANDAGEGSSEEEVEMSEYEKMRAERVARNAERLKSLGLN